MSPLSLYELNHMVSEVLALSLDDTYWVVAEIAELREHATGHCYLELVEKEESQQRRGRVLSPSGGNFKAKAKATIWSFTWSRLAPKFFQETGQHLAQGMKVLLNVKVTFHEQYGYSLNVQNIDPTYTLGDMARKRQEILQQLAEDGIINDNKALRLPRPLQRIAVISAAGAAGYGDFCQQLDESGFRFATKLFPATMQGSEVEASVIRALNLIAENIDEWDCVVIIRGGGAVADLNGFESYELAANVAQFPLPVLTGIGHERDDTVIDVVANTRLKTPTAVAQFLIDNMRRELEEVEDLEARLLQGIDELLLEYRKRFERVAYRYERAATNYTNAQKQHLLRLSARMEVAIQSRLQRQQHGLELVPQQLTNASARLLQKQQQRLDFLERTLNMAGPERILKMGYSITTGPDGKVIRSASDVEPGTILHTQLADGEITSQAIM